MSVVTMCKNGLHEKSEPGECKKCRAAKDAKLYAENPAK